MLPIREDESSEVRASLDALYERYGKYAVPTATLRAILDEEMGGKTLTGELYKMRGEG